MSKQHLFCQFPKLKNDSQFVIIDPHPDAPIDKYNCFAYALEQTGAFWAPEREWPKEVPARLNYPNHLDSYIELFECFGYVRCCPPFGVRPEQQALDPDVEKIALYARERTANNVRYLQCPHAAKQLPSGLWSSKNNQFEIFVHALESLESESDSAATQASPPECIEPRPGGGTYTRTPLNFGRIALIMSRRSLNH
jgi:hypothetical protein